MEKSVSPTKEKVSEHIYDDIALVILSKLPLKSLIRFSCVCKSWSPLIQNPYFMTMFRNNFLSKDHSYYNDTSLFPPNSTPWNNHNHICRHNLCSLFGERFENMVKLDWPKPFEDPFDYIINGSASVNGILCIQVAGRGPEGILGNGEELERHVLWNPATGEFHITPPSPFSFESPSWDPVIDFHGFGYDQKRDDYKIIRNVTFFYRFAPDVNETRKDDFDYPFWEMYCLNSNSWKILDIDMPIHYYSSGVHAYIDGVCHWWGESETCKEVYLASFDLSNETFVKTSIPSNMSEADIDIGIDDTRFVCRHLVVLNGSIGWLTYYEEVAPTFHISILGEVGVKESWTKLFTVGPLFGIVHPIGVGKKGDIFFRKDDNELVWFNSNTQRMKELGIKVDYCCKIVVYKESFLPFARKIN
ncbi:F-box protein CPR1-like [Vicia villosa]|uniref:F-box protein CPR1-like n=1 Tax=Vicia villosa TaxID=3911 RepID=UPI00273BE089|nr:F-box protein CPR1-like [Vicia villosa]